MAPLGRRSTAGGMDEALRYNQQLQFCKQLHHLQQQLCEDTHLSDELLNSLYALGKFCKTPACCLQQLAGTYPEVRVWCVLLLRMGVLQCQLTHTLPHMQFASKLQRSVKQHPLKEMHIEQVGGSTTDAHPGCCQGGPGSWSCDAVAAAHTHLVQCRWRGMP